MFLVGPRVSECTCAPEAAAVLGAVLDQSARSPVRAPQPPPAAGRHSRARCALCIVAFESSLFAQLYAFTVHMQCSGVIHVNSISIKCVLYLYYTVYYMHCYRVRSSDECTCPLMHTSILCLR